MAKPLSQAQQADKYVLYQEAVQNAHYEMFMLSRVFKDAYGAQAQVLREDFCGTGAICRAWVMGDPGRQAHGVDLDPEPLAWGRTHNAQHLNQQERPRLELLEGDACTVGNTPPADVISAGNYSFNVFTQRAVLREYFRAAHQNLRPQGVLMLDVTGGPQVITAGHKHRRPMEQATYEWETVAFDAITHEGTYRINFYFPDGSSLVPAFEYQWRIWMPPELRDLLLECGFRRAVYYVGREGADGVLDFERQHATPADARVYAYLAAIK